MPDNLEMRARAICAADLDSARHRGCQNEAIERYWPVVAAEIVDGAGTTVAFVPPADMAARLAEYRQLRRRGQHRGLAEPIPASLHFHP